MASTNIIESMNSVIRRVCRNVKRWRDAKMALRWTSAGMFEAQKGFRPHQSIQATPILGKLSSITAGSEKPNLTS